MENEIQCVLKNSAFLIIIFRHSQLFDQIIKLNISNSKALDFHLQLPFICKTEKNGAILHQAESRVYKKYLQICKKNCRNKIYI